MTANFLMVFLTVSLGQGASPYGPGAALTAPNSTQAFNTGDPTYLYDAPQPWVHGYWQEIPAYGGHHFFRPYNYKHVFAQSQVAGAWGMSPNIPYSHEYFRRIDEQVAMERRLSQMRMRQPEYASMAPRRPYDGQTQPRTQLPYDPNYRVDPNYGVNPNYGVSNVSGYQTDPRGYPVITPATQPRNVPNQYQGYTYPRGMGADPSDPFLQR